MILGINAYHGDVAAAALVNGRLVMAVEEERYRRVKHWAGIPVDSIRACIAAADEPVEHVAVSRDPRAHLWRKLWFAARHRPSAAALLDRARNSRALGDLASVLRPILPPSSRAAADRLHAIEHHTAHLASAFYASPFDDAAVCAIDGFGDFVSTSWGIGADRRLSLRRRVFFPHSLGLLYVAVTQFLGFQKYGDEYKVMGLAPYGAPDFADRLRRLVRLHPDGGFELDLSYFRHHTSGITMTWRDGEPSMGRVFTPALEALLGPARDPARPVEPRHEAIAASLQLVFEEAAFHVLNAVHRQTSRRRLCLAGGCAMNSVMNGKIRERTPFEEVYVQPAAADNGTALGAALYVAHQRLGQPRGFVMEHAYWGPAFTDGAIDAAIDGRRRDVRACARLDFQSHDDLCAWTAGRLAEGLIVGWFQGHMEWGARALGNRSILADPRRSDMREIINTKIKFREKFRPFAPSILEEALDEYFVGAVADPFMIQVYPVRPDKRQRIPAVTHVDGSGRLQTVSHRHNPAYWSLIDAFRRLTGVPVLLNTSFNENEPIVLQPAEALDCFLRTDLDVLVMGRRALVKPAVAERAVASSEAAVTS